MGTETLYWIATLGWVLAILNWFKADAYWNKYKRLRYWAEDIVLTYDTRFVPDKINALKDL